MTFGYVIHSICNNEKKKERERMNLNEVKQKQNMIRGRKDGQTYDDRQNAHLIHVHLIFYSKKSVRPIAS